MADRSEYIGYTDGAMSTEQFADALPCVDFTGTQGVHIFKGFDFDAPEFIDLTRDNGYPLEVVSSFGSLYTRIIARKTDDERDHTSRIDIFELHRDGHIYLRIHNLLFSHVKTQAMRIFLQYL